jgi:hypothetical protein
MPELSDQDRGAIAAAVQAIQQTTKLTADGKLYCERFAGWLLKSNGKARRMYAPKRPRCPFPLAQGQWLRRRVVDELRRELSNDGRRLDIDGITL